MEVVMKRNKSIIFSLLLLFCAAQVNTISAAYFSWNQVFAGGYSLFKNGCNLVKNNPQVTQMCQIGTSRNAILTGLVMPNWHANNIQLILIRELRYSIRY